MTISNFDNLPKDVMIRVNQACNEFEERWRTGEQPTAEDMLPDDCPEFRNAVLRELLPLEIEYRRQCGLEVIDSQYRQRFPDIDATWLAALIGDRPESAESNANEQKGARPQDGSRVSEQEHPTALGRYKILHLVGSGGFGTVYRARDEQLSREVAIKVPFKERIGVPQDAKQFLTEAQVIAGLDHAHIVPVYDVGRTDDGTCYVVSKFIDGCELTARLGKDDLRLRHHCAILADVADALHHAHLGGIYHRDVKPANILLDSDDRVYVADFGLAVRDSDHQTNATIVGTPAYMSPEQARGEGHRVDGRTDIFSLGAVLYELLTGRKPFRGESTREVLEQVKYAEPRPPRQVRDAIPRELERICLKALSKRVSERYSTARDLAEDLQRWTSTADSDVASPTSSCESPAANDSATRPSTTKRTGLTQRLVEPQIVPRGLRSFSEQDADFFLELLPGPRNRGGLPDSIDFWKTRIDSSNPELAFAVGAIYGPSGCGKSSFVRAGLIPRLADYVDVAYVEATPHGTEASLTSAIRHYTETASSTADVSTLIPEVRRHGLGDNRKLLIVVDQFEQWLHANPSPKNESLVDGLRHCDGIQVQCLLLVRDDFWLSQCRFMDALEVDLQTGKNVAVIDLFDKLHAARVLTYFGRAYGRLPNGSSQLSAEEIEFVNDAVDNLARDERIVSVRLAVFADLVKGKLWEPDTLEQFGGMQGLGVMFLEDSFSARTAMPKHRLHEPAARAVLKSLLPRHGADIKGARRSQEELLVTSGYATAPAEFDRLMRILDGELRLITPADEPSQNSASSFYQLTHDYLVPSLREWLNRKQRETAQGRAELTLNEQAALWTDKPSTRNLPSPWEWISVRSLTQPAKWSAQERNMMRAANRFYGFRSAVAVLLVVAAVWLGHQLYRRAGANAMVQSLVVAGMNEVPSIVRNLESYRRLAIPVIEREWQTAQRENDRAKKLRCALALLPHDDTQVQNLINMLPDASFLESGMICEALHRRRGQLGMGSETLIDLVVNAEADEFRRFMRVVYAQSNDADPFLRFVAASRVRPIGPERQKTDEAQPTDELRQRIVLAQGMLTDRWAFCQTMPFDQAVETIQQLRQYGYRPTRFRPFPTAGKVYAAVAWQRDNRRWRIEIGKSGDGLLALNEELQREGHVPIEVSGYLDRQALARYIGIWVEPDDNAVRRVVLIGTDADHLSSSSRWLRQHCRAVVYNKFLLADGTVGSCVIREFTNSNAHGGTYCASEFGTKLRRDLLQTDIQLLHLPWDGVVRTDDELKRLEAAIADSPSNHEALFRLGYQQAIRGQHQAAVDTLTRLIDADRASPNTYALRASGWAALGNLTAARNDLQTCSAELTDPLRRALYTMRARAELGEAKGAVADIEEAVLSKDVSASRLVDASRAYSIAYAATRDRDNDLSDQYADRAIELFEQAIDQGLARHAEDARTWRRESPSFDGIRSLPQFRRMLTRREYDQEYQAVWVNYESLESRTLFQLPVDEHLQECKTLASDGFRIAAVSVADVDTVSSKLMAASVWHRDVTDPETEAQINAQRANAIIAAYLIGKPETLWAALRQSPTPDLRSYLVNRLHDYGVEPVGLEERLGVETDVSAQRALILAIGEYEPTQFSPSLLQMLWELHRNDPDCGIHSATEWVLRRWGHGAQLDQLAETPVPPSTERSWFVNSIGQTFTVVRAPLTFTKGSPHYEVNREEDEKLREHRFTRSFAVATTAVTVDEYQEFLDAHPGSRSTLIIEYSPEGRCPVMSFSWYSAAEYCNWLSGLEGLEPVYVPNSKGKYARGMSFHANYLRRSGYRLPSQAELEYVVRANTKTAWSFGNTPRLLDFYGWHVGTSQERSWPVGTLKPNDFGLFDGHGNCREWLQQVTTKKEAGAEEDTEMDYYEGSGIAGGSWRHFARTTRSAHADTGYTSGSKDPGFGFRIGRTLLDE